MTQYKKLCSGPYALGETADVGLLLGTDMIHDMG